jgi:hypothetical protein
MDVAMRAALSPNALYLNAKASLSRLEFQYLSYDLDIALEFNYSIFITE